MDPAKLRAWWWQKQGLDGSLKGATPAQVLERAGWARSVGGSNAYLTMFTRCGIGGRRAEEALAKLQIHELPSARGCTYFIPASDFALALKVGQGFGDAGDFANARRHFSYTDKELKSLQDGVLKALKSGPMDPKTLKGALGDLVRNFGDEGKRRGITTSLPLALGSLQSQGLIRRMPSGGRLDTQRFSYTLWDPSPLAEDRRDNDEAFRDLASRFLMWTGPVTISQFAWFSGKGKTEAKKALLAAGAEVLNGDFLMLPEDKESFADYKPPKDKQYSLVACIDSLFLLRRDVVSFVEESDKSREVFAERGFRQIGHLMDLPSHAIIDRGRLVGLWEYEPSSESIAWFSFAKPDGDMKSAVASMEAFIRDDLGDARSFSLDSPEGRASRIEQMRQSFTK